MDLTYFKQASASTLFSNEPIDKNVSVAPIRGAPIRGAPIRGVDNFSPIAPLPLAFGMKILYLKKFIVNKKNIKEIKNALSGKKRVFGANQQVVVLFGMKPKNGAEIESFGRL